MVCNSSLLDLVVLKLSIPFCDVHEMSLFQIGKGARGDVTILPTLVVNNRQYRGIREQLTCQSCLFLQHLTFSLLTQIFFHGIR